MTEAKKIAAGLTEELLACSTQGYGTFGVPYACEVPIDLRDRILTALKRTEEAPADVADEITEAEQINDILHHAISGHINTITRLSADLAEARKVIEFYAKPWASSIAQQGDQSS